MKKHSEIRWMLKFIIPEWTTFGMATFPIRKLARKYKRNNKINARIVKVRITEM